MGILGMFLRTVESTGWFSGHKSRELFCLALGSTPTDTPGSVSPVATHAGIPTPKTELTPWHFLEDRYLLYSLRKTLLWKISNMQRSRENSNKPDVAITPLQQLLIRGQFSSVGKEEPLLLA